jgi:hypothetical protein
MVANPRVRPRAGRGLDRDEIDPNWQLRQGLAVRQAIPDQPPKRQPQVAPFAVAERLLRQPEVAAPAPADFHDHERRRRARVDRHEVELVATDMDVPGKDGPARVAQSGRDELLRGVTRQLSRRPAGPGAWIVHGRSVAGGPHPPIIASSRGGSAGSRS